MIEQAYQLHLRLALAAYRARNNPDRLARCASVRLRAWRRYSRRWNAENLPPNTD